MIVTVIACMCLAVVTASGNAVAPPPEAGQAALWSVQTSDETEAGVSEHCLLVSGNLSVIFVHRGEDARTMSEDLRRLHWTKKVPSEAIVSGECGDLSSEVSLEWSEVREDTGETNLNLINLVITRNNRISELTGVFARLFLHSKEFELTSSMKKNDPDSLSWPHRYCLSCQKTLYYPLYKVSTVKRNHNDDKSDDVPPEAFLMIDNLMFEVFRNSEGSETDLMSKFFSKRKWECEFHKIYSWAPYALGGCMVFLLFAMVFCFFFKSCLGCSDRPWRRLNNNNYEKL